MEKADFVFGSMVLHHIEPFEEFARSLREIVKPGGKGFFRENNARSSVMIWFRQNIVGKLWVPKDGDPDEFPLTPGEVDEMRNHFNVEIEYPEMLLFQLFSRYVLRGHLGKPFQMLDDFCGRYPALRKYSYRQNLYIS